MSGITSPHTGAPQSGCTSTVCPSEKSGQRRARAKPSWYQCALVVPRRMSPVATSTSNMTHEWSVEAPARPARKQADSTSTPPSSREEASAGRWCRLAREAVTRRRVERGATGGSSLAIEGAFERAGCRIQSPPCAALRKVWRPRPPSSLRCLTTIARSEREGEAATPCRSHAARNSCLSYGEGSGKALGRFREGSPHARARERRESSRP
mmetsp:Transcript_47942/g.156944  ORF Transcript_47942/g.156944 Transcript_47942/m.156944 type:complete len:210 (+) Transcript_47942:441-1070(+)